MGYEHVKLPRSLLERLAKVRVIKGELTPSCAQPIDVVRLDSLSWGHVSGHREIPVNDLRTHQSLYRKLELAKLLTEAQQLGSIVPADPGSFIEAIQSHLPKPPKPPEQLLVKAEPSKWQPPSVRSGIDLACVMDKAALQLFGGTSVVRDAADGCMSGLRGKLRRARAQRRIE